MERKFPALHVVSALLKILAWILAIVDVCAVVLIALKKFPLEVTGGSPIALAVVFLLGGAIYFLVLYAFAEGIHVGLAIEENTRAAAKEKP
jgi:hypothetical protein